jgi:molybdopterin-guanine dinucleotide biosynthesis protein
VTDLSGISEIITKYLNDVNIVLVEGYRGDDYPRIKIVDSKGTEAEMNDSDNELILIKENLETKRFSPEDTNKALDFIEKIIHLK